jgi:hypothetical protein
MDPNTMATARALFGITFGIGTRNIPPRKGLPRKVLEVGNIINLVMLSEADTAPEGRQKVKEFISGQRIDLVYEEATRVLTVRITYCDQKAEAKIVSEIHHAVKEELKKYLWIRFFCMMISFSPLQIVMVAWYMLRVVMMENRYALITIFYGI